MKLIRKWIRIDFKLDRRLLEYLSRLDTTAPRPNKVDVVRCAVEEYLTKRGY